MQTRVCSQILTIDAQVCCMSAVVRKNLPRLLAAGIRVFERFLATKLTVQ